MYTWILVFFLIHLGNQKVAMDYNGFHSEQECLVVLKSIRDKLPKDKEILYSAGCMPIRSTTEQEVNVPAPQESRV